MCFAGPSRDDLTPRSHAARTGSQRVDDLRGAGDGLGLPDERTVRDARGGGIAGLLGDLVASGAPVLAITAHAGHRAAGLRDRVGGFAVTTWAALDSDPGFAAAYTHVVAVDPPPHAHLRALVGQLPGDGWTHLAWGGAELELARRVLTWELDLRPQLTDLYRGLRAVAPESSSVAASSPVASASAGAAPAAAAPTVAGERLFAALRGSGPQPRSGALSGRLLRVLAELELVALDPAALAVGVPPPSGRTELERSPAFRAYAERLRDGLAYLAEPARASDPGAPSWAPAVAVA
jgi:single-stranded-DNA-specific exonuclease